MLFNEYMASKEVVFGLFSKTSDPFLVEICGKAGFDFIILDNEHGPNDIRLVYPLILAAENSGLYPIVRVGKLADIEIQRTLDVNPAGVQIPQIQSRQDAQLAVRYSKYYPQGMRGVCRFVRGADYSLKERGEFFAEQNQKTVIIHIEGMEGIRAFDEIVEVAGIDVIFIGPYDLSQSLGLPGQVSDPKVLAAIEKLTAKCREKGKYVGIFADTPEAAKRYKDLGVKYIAYSVDVGIFAEACRELTKKLKAL